MYHLVQGLYSKWNRQEEYRVLILGLDSAGKTTLLEHLKKLYKPNAKITPAERIVPTVGQNFAKLNINGTTLKIWDIGGQTVLRSLWQEYYAEAHAIVFVVDSTDRDRIEECREALKEVVTDDEVEGIPILMLANKQDCQEHMEVEDIKEIFNKIAEQLSARDSRVLPISALKGDGVEEAAEWLVIRLIRNKKNRPPNYK